MLGLIVVTLLISLICNIILKRFGLPTIIGYIATGTIIAYSFGLHDAVHNHTLKETAEFGVVFLMFTIGLEFSLTHLKKMRYEVFVAGSLQILITSGVVYLLSVYLMGIEQKMSIVIALAIALSSTAIVLKTFNENGEINKRYGQRALGVLIMQDIAVIPILLLLGFMANDSGDVSKILLETFINATILLVILYVLGKFFLEKFFILIIKTDSDELFVSTILFLAIGSSFLAHELGFSYSLGAFMAGMLISETKFKHQAEADLVPFRDILLGIFFITVGMQIDFSVIAQYFDVILILLVAIFILKFVIIFSIMKLRESNKTSFKTALSIVQVGEFSLAILELARTHELIIAPHSQIMIVTIVISMILTPVILKNLTKITDIFIKKDQEEQIITGCSPDDISDHVVILGYGEFGQSVAKAFKKKGELYIIVENDIHSYHKGVDRDEPIIFGNALKKEVLKNTYLKSAKKVIVAIDNPQKLYHICETISKDIGVDKILVKVHSHREKKSLEELDIKNIIVENEQTSRAVVECCA